MKESNCKGCNSTCLNIEEINGIICPCVNCLLKVMCTDICKAYHEFELVRSKAQGSLWPAYRIVKTSDGTFSITYIKDITKYANK